jgi:integrase
MEKYRAFSKNGWVFDLFCQVKINKLLKDMTTLCGINKTLSFHMSRHTFATQVCLSQGVPKNKQLLMFISNLKNEIKRLLFSFPAGILK